MDPMVTLHRPLRESLLQRTFWHLYFWQTDTAFVKKNNNKKQGHFWKYLIQTILWHFCLSDCWHLCVAVTWIGKQGLEFPHMCRQLTPSKNAALLVLWGVKEMSWSIYWPQSTSIWEYASSSKRHSLEICIILLLTSRTLKYDWCDV